MTGFLICKQARISAPWLSDDEAIHMVPLHVRMWMVEEGLYAIVRAPVLKGHYTPMAGFAQYCFLMIHDEAKSVLFRLAFPDYSCDEAFLEECGDGDLRKTRRSYAG